MDFDFQVPGEETSALLEAITRHGSFHAVKQPIVRMDDGSPVAYEYLSRSTLPGSPMPEEFLRFCMAHNILRLADLYCLKNCVQASTSLSTRYQRHMNLYPSTLATTPVERILAAFPASFPPGLFCVELNENFIVDDPGELVAPVAELKRRGIHLAIDDVGFGRSCLEAMVLLEPHFLKIDRKVVSGLSKDRRKARTLSRILRVASALGARAIAEGIESQEDLSALRDLGVTHGQGFYWGRPA